MSSDAFLPAGACGRLMPMHLHLDAGGAILSAGSTLRKLTGRAERFGEAFQLIAPAAEPGAEMGALAGEDRLFLRLRAEPQQVLRGRGIRLDHGGVLLNLGFGIGLVHAVRRFGLTDRDFAPSELAIELLFLHEANGAMMAELARYNQRMEEARVAAEAQAVTDPLTGLRNRRALEAAVRQAALGAGAPSRRPFALMNLDLDFFKSINDEHGHDAGDRVLQVVAARMAEVTRSGDTIARVGGDEFVLLLPGMADEAALVQLGHRLISRIEAPIAYRGASCLVSASAGVAISCAYPRPDPAVMQRDADAALYRAKAGGRGCLRIAQPGEGAPEGRS